MGVFVFMLIEAVKSILFPVFCVECGVEGEWWCDNCLKQHPVAIIKRCPFCGQSADGRTCPGCRTEKYLDGALAFVEYDDKSVIAKLLHDFKYCHAYDVQFVWKKLFQAYPDKEIFQAADCLVPVPLYKKRERERGYNQAEILTDLIITAGQNNLLYKNNALKRVKETKQQATLSKSERLKNVGGAFVFTAAAKLPDKVAIVDDVLTSGATLNECARVLKSNGAKEVWAITLARAV